MHSILNQVVAAANLKNGMSRYQRSSSPGSRKLVIPGRSSTGTFPSSYEPHSGYSRSPRDDYATPRSGGVVPISTEVYTNYPPSAPGSAYSGRPRARAGSDAIPPSIRTRAVIHDNGVARPSSPLTRNYETVHVKPATTRHEHKKMYSIDNGSARLIAETEVAPRDNRKERSSYHLTGSGGTSSRSRDIDDASFSYTDPAGMYRDTEPRYRSRRGSVDRDNRRPVSMIDAYMLPPPPRPTREAGPPPSTRGFDKIVPLGRGSGSLRDPVRSSARDVPVRSSSRDGHRPSTYDGYREDTSYDRTPLRASTVMPIVLNPARDNREDRYYQEEYDGRERDPRRSRRFEDEAVAARGFGIRSGSVDRHRSNSSSAEVLARPPPPPPPGPAAAIYGSEPLVKIPSVSDYAPKPVMEDRRTRAEPRMASGLPLPVLDDRKDRVEPRKTSNVNDYPPPPREERPMSRAMPREERLPPRDDRSAPREERRDRGEPRSEPRDLPRNDYLPAPVREERRSSEDRRDRDRDSQRDRDRGDRKEREHDRTREREREREREYERPREREYDEPRREDKPRRDEKGREDKGREDKPREDKTRDLAAKGVAAAGVAAAGAMAGAVYQDKRNRDKREESDEERRKSRREPNDKEDDRERKYAERDRDDRRKDKKEAIDPDEDYRRRVQQAELELTRQRSNEDDRSGSDRERRRRDKREREERERQEKERRDRPLEIQDAPPPAALRREDILPMPKEAVPVRREPVPVGRGRDYSESVARSDDQHNHYDSRQSNVLNGPILSEPESIGRELPATAGATATAGALVSTRNGGPASETADEREQRERRVTIVEPRKDDPLPEVPVKGILRRPTKVFPEYPNPIREGVTPLKERLEKKGASLKEIPKDAKWTKIDRKLVNPQALEEKGVRFEERLDCVIVLSVLTRDEISAFAKRTEEIRGKHNSVGLGCFLNG